MKASLLGWRALKTVFGLLATVSLLSIPLSGLAAWSFWFAGAVLAGSIVAAMWPTPRWLRSLRIAANQERLAAGKPTRGEA